MPTSPTATASESDDISQAFYIHVMNRLNTAGVPFLVGGAFALARFTGIERNTKDFDIFVRREDVERTLAALSDDTCRTEFTFTHWLAKAICGHDFVDIIFASGNAVSPVDDEWFEHAPAENVLGVRALLSPPEEMIWSKAFIMERERFDGADVMHLFLRCGPHLDWARLLRRFGDHWRVLFAHIVMFNFVYPGEHSKIPVWVIEHLTARLQKETREPPPNQHVCQGPLISRAQYLIDIQLWGNKDARLGPNGFMSDEEVKRWTAAIHEPKPVANQPDPVV
jgi:hypothetical protein